MAKILIKKEKKEFIKELNKEVVVDRGRIYYVADETKDFSATEGIISKKDLKKKDGSLIKSSKGKEFTIISSDFIDDYKRIRRGSQIITLKDIGYIITETGLNKNSKVVDAGAGSGALACYMAYLCKEVVTYEIKDESYDITKDNIKFLGLNNVKLKKKNIHKGIDEKDVDIITLDLPDPWNAIGAADKALKIGGFLVVYLPNIIQVSDFVNEIKKYDNFIVIKTIELIERSWKIKGRIARPKSEGIGHTGFLTFCRKIR